jgi:hypothetical protein
VPTLIVDKRGADDQLFLRALPGMALRIRHIVEKEIWSAPFFGSSSGLKNTTQQVLILVPLRSPQLPTINDLSSL